MERFFVSRPIFAICIALAIVLLGAISIFDLSIEQYPDITPPVVEVTASYSGADAETVNDAVATPVAQSVMGVSDMLYMQSTSANDGSMVLQVVFDVGTDPDLDAIFTQNNVATSTALLPSSVVTQGVVTQKTMTGFLMVFALHSDGRYDNEFLSNYAYINLQNQLLKINGVGKVSIMGAGEYAMRIWVKPDLLNYYNVSLDELRAAVLAEGGIYPAGQFGAEPSPEGTTYTYTVTMPRQISTAEEFAAIVVKTTPAGEQIFLRDVADVALGSKSYGVASAFGEEPATLLVIYQEPGSNAVDVGNRVKAAIGRLSERFPDGVSCTTIVDSTESIRSGVEEIILTLILALVLVIAIIYLFIQDWRATLIPLVAIPVSLIGTFIFFPLLGFSINIISLLGLVLAIGLVVDDAIVVVEAAQVNIERGMKSREAAIEAMRNVASPIVATTVVLLAVFIPMSFVGGISGRLFQQFAVTISVSVVLSAFNALTLSPALCALLPQGGGEGFLRRIQPAVRPLAGRLFLADRRHRAPHGAYRRAVAGDRLCDRCGMVLHARRIPSRRGPGLRDGRGECPRSIVAAGDAGGAGRGRPHHPLAARSAVYLLCRWVQHVGRHRRNRQRRGLRQAGRLLRPQTLGHADRRGAQRDALRGAARGRGLRLHPAVDSGSGRHVGPVGRYAGFGRARYGLPGRADGALPRFAAPPAGNRYGHHVVQRRRPAAKAGDRQSLRHAGRGGAERRLFGHNGLFGRCLHQQLQPFRKVVPDLSVGRTRLSDGPHVARQLFREERP